MASYNRIEFTEDISLSFPFFPAPGTESLADTLDLLPNGADLVVTLPDVTQGSAGQRYIVRNIHETNQVTVEGGDFTVILEVGDSRYLILTAVLSEEEGGIPTQVWSEVVLSRSIDSSISSIEVEHTVASAEFTAVTLESVTSGDAATLRFDVSKTLEDIHTLDGTGYLTRNESNKGWVLKEFDAGAGINIDNEDASDGNTTISIADSISALTLGNFVFNENALTSEGEGDLNIRTGGNLIINGVQFDTEGNVSGTVSGENFTGGLGLAAPKAWIVLTDSTGLTAPQIEQSYNINVSMVREESNGLYTIPFTRPLSNTAYGVHATISHAREIGGVPNRVLYPRMVSRALESCVIGVFTSEGELTSRTGATIFVTIFGA